MGRLTDHEYVSKLSKGALRKILDGDDVRQPVVQILAYKKMPVDTSGQPRYRFMVSDGESQYQACMMMGANLEAKIEKGEFERFAIIRLNAFSITHTNNGSSAILLNEPILLYRGSEVARKVGNPQALEAKVNTDLTPTKRQSENRDTNGSTASQTKRAPDPRECRPIETLNSFQSRNNQIKGTCIAKSQIRTWSNQKGDGKLFSFELKDDTGEVRVTAFTAQCDLFYDVVELGKAYIVTKATVKTANRQFYKGGEFEMTLTDESQVYPVSEDASCPALKYDFVRLADLQARMPGEEIDVAVVARSVGPVETLTSKKNGKEFHKRDVRVVDESGAETTLTLWAGDAVDFKGQEGSVLLIRHCRISDYSGRSLSGGSGFTLQVDVEGHEVVKSLRGWYSRSDKNFQSLTTAMGGRDDSIKPLFQLYAEATNDPNKKTYGSIIGYITRALKVNHFLGCTSEGCKKKVIDMNNGTYRCEGCGNESEQCHHKYIQSFVVADDLGQHIVTAFHDDLKKLMDMDDNQLHEVFKEGTNNDEARKRMMERLLYRPLHMRVSFGVEFYKEEQRVKGRIVKSDPVDYVDYSRKLISTIKHFSALQLNR